MTIEQNLKTLIGEYTFQICVLQTQLEEANKKISEFLNKSEENTSSEISNA